MAIPKRFSGPEFLGITPATLYTVPAQRRIVIRHIHVKNNTDATRLFSFSIGLMNGDLSVFEDYPIAPRSVFDHFPFYVLEATELYQAAGDTDGELNLTVDGEEDLTA